MSAPRWTGAGMLWIEADNARMSARPTGVPLTAENVADAEECRDMNQEYERTMKRTANGWTYAGGRWTFSDTIMVYAAHINGTVVTKWRNP